MTPALAIPAPEQVLDWAHAPSRFAWSVVVFGGKNPRTGFDQPQMEVQFHKRTRPNGFGYDAKGILHRANDYAKAEHRSHFAVRDTDGSVIYTGPILNEIEAPVVIGRLTDAQLVAHAVGQRRFARAGGV